MTPEHEAAIRRAAILGYHLAAIEHALDSLKAAGCMACLPEIIRQHVHAVAPHAPTELRIARRIVRGIYE